ncbi:Cellobiose dehydrogenase [Apiospora arundinis]
MFRKLSTFRQKRSDRENGTNEERPGVSSALARPPGSNSTLGLSDQFRSSSSSLPVVSTPTAINQLSRRTSESEPGPLGLNVVYTPENGHKADIVFIHGLGGTSRLTWSKHKNPDLFWPLTFLPLEPDICLARILTFGYNANIRKSGQISTSVLDFAKDLLFDLKYGKDSQKEELNMGKVPLIFVVHSMGGLIIKEAYMQGQHDPEYKMIIKAISAITFIATPHRGTHLAETLNRILQSSMITNSKQYVLELAKNSPTLQKLNEQFRHIAPKLDIISFYETEPTSIGLKNARVMVLERDTSVLGYPGETSKALIADHHGVCKYDSPDDPNYITVRNVIKSLVSKIIATNKINIGKERRASVKSRQDIYDLQKALAIYEMPETDYVYHRDLWTEGTCDWVGGPATGKSVLSSFIVNTLVESGALCQYFFMKFGDPKKRSTSVLLRSLAYQLSRDIPQFSQQLMELVGEAIDLPNASPRLLWERIFKSILFNIEQTGPVYWVVDGLDEAEDPQGVIRLLSDLTSSKFPLRILFVGRDMPATMAAFQRLPEDLKCATIDIDAQEDLRYFVQRELNMPGSNEFRERISNRVIEGAQGNFLWARLAINRLSTCHKQSQVEAVLQDFPVGMEALFDRMATSITRHDSPEARDFAAKIIGFVSCSLKKLTVSGLSQALGEAEADTLDIQRSIIDLCSGFVTIDNDGGVSLVHQTAREYLLRDVPRPFRVNPKTTHESLFLSCINCLRTNGLRTSIAKNQVPDFIDYASLYWSSHLLFAPIESEHITTELIGFLNGQSILTWIQLVSRSKQLRALVQVSKNISKYVAKLKTLRGPQSMKAAFIMQQTLLESWAVDLVKIMGKFGPNLIRKPESVYKVIPPFCPQNSAVFQQFGKGESRSLSVKGLIDWDDSLTRMSLGFGAYTSSIRTAGSFIAILATPGNVFVFDSATFDAVTGSPFKHGERVYSMEISAASATLVTYGYRTTKAWNISTGECKLTLSNMESRPRPLTMLLTNHGKKLIVGFDDRQVRSLNLAEDPPSWQSYAELEEPELEGHFLNSANLMATNGDGSLFAVAYRGHPLSAWETEGPIHLGHCWRKRDELSRGEVIDAVWHPMSPEVLGVYIEGVVFKWLPYEDVVEEIHVGASKIAISSDGNLFITGDVHGTVKVFSTPDLGLIYQLGSQDTILGLAFSPDSRRFYDIRGYYASAWEPSVLVKMMEQADANIDTSSDSISLVPSSVHPAQYSCGIDSITALSADPQGHYFGSGTEKGVVHLHDTEGKVIGEVYASRGLLSIEHMVWSSDGKLLSFTNSSKQLFVYSVSQEPNYSPEIKKVLEISLRVASKGPILQILLDSMSGHVIIHTQSNIQLISLELASTACSLAFDAIECRWLLHPNDSNLVIGVAPGTVYLLHCKYFVLRSFHYDVPASSGDRPISWEGHNHKVERVLASSDRRNLLVQLSLPKLKLDGKVFLYFPLSGLSWEPSGDANEAHSIKLIPLCIPLSISPNIILLLSFMSQNRLVYLSRDFAVSTFRVVPGSDWSSIQTSTSLHTRKDPKTRTIPTTELFALPRDWIGKDCLTLGTIWGKGKSFLCPRNGEVTVVRSSGLV